ncbi:MAG: response regulator transcription factor, partial [bacterium]|nr:response regulator transcription factor [bacterium]
MTRPRIFVVEDEALSRAGVRHYLEDSFDIVGEADNVSEAVALICDLVPDLVLLDLRIKGGAGVDVIRQVRTTHASVKFLALTVSTSRIDVLRLLSIGVDGYLTKGVIGADLPDRVTEALNGGRPISKQVAGYVLDINEGISDESDIDRLTQRQLEVTRLIARGYTYRETAGTLGISVKTLEKHMGAIFHRLGLASRHELSALAYESGL